MVVRVELRGIYALCYRLYRRVVRRRPRHLPEAACIPELVAEVPSELDSFLAEKYVLALRRAVHDAEAQAVGAVAGNDVERVGGIAEALGHLAPLHVADNSREIHVFERNARAHRARQKFQPRHNHSRDPEEYDVGPRDEVGCRVEFIHLKFAHFFFVRPAHGCEGPEPRACPSVEGILVLHPVFGVRRPFDRNVHFVRIVDVGVFYSLLIPHGNPVSPPDLARDAPVADIVEPVRVGFFPALGPEFYCSRFDRRLCLLDFRIAHEPLVGQARLNRNVSALGVSDVVFVVLHGDELPEFVELFYGELARLEPVEPLEIFSRKRVHCAVGVHYVDYFEVVALAYFKVGWVVSGGDFQYARSECHIHVFVADNRDFRAWEGADCVLADEVGVAFVLRIYGDGRVAHNGFRAGCRNLQKNSRLFGELVLHFVELAFAVGHYDFFVGQGCEVYGAPVYHSLAAVDVAFFKELYERCEDGF